MTPVRAFNIVILSGLGFAAAGALLGLAVGVLSPESFRVLFRVHPDLPFDPARFGTAIGLTQGLYIGLGTGLVIVLAVTGYNARNPSPPQ